ncbi:MAG: SDR family NAD(P)-dependent oxidoreductase [Pseudomonadota bacterium]
MTTKTVLITGGNSGIGLAIAKEMARRGGVRLCLASRDMKKMEAARAEIQAQAPGTGVELYALDLASLAKIRAFAADFLSRHQKLDALVNNAGAYPAKQQFTADGYEFQFGANYLGPVLLTHLLLPALQRSDDGRIVHMSSMMHMLGNIDASTFRGRRFYIGTRAYGQSKLGNLLFSHALARRLNGITSNAMHPGGVNSPIYDDLPGFLQGIIRPFLITAEPAAKLASDLALAPEHRQTTGRYLTAQPPSFSSPRSRNVELQESLYAESCALLDIEPLPLRG